MSAQLALLPDYLTGHLQLTLLALLFGIAVSVPLGILATRIGWLEQVVLGVAGAIQTVPSLALLAVMVPLLAALGLESIGFLPAIIGLTLYGLLPILRNTVTGIRGVDPALKEAALGVGMTEAQQLRRVELPLALPVIVGGIRTATVWTVGMATLSTPVGATSLGNYIFSGLQTRNFAAVLVGSIAAAVLALLLDALVHGVEVGIRDRRRGVLIATLGLFALLFAFTAVTLAASRFGGGARPIKIGAKTFTEQYILAEILADQIEKETGEQTQIVSSLGSTVVFDALRSGEIDVYVDYSGTLWVNILRRSDLPASREQAIEEIGRVLAERDGVELVGSLGFENAYALAMTGAKARELGVETISQLVPFAARMSIGADYEFLSRPEWRSIEKAYGLRMAQQRSMDPSLMYQAVAQGNVDVISAFTTDGRIEALDLIVLDDDRNAIPPYDAVILASARLATEHPEVIQALRGLIGKIDASEMRALNLAVDEKGETPAKVAGRFFASDLEAR